MWRFGALLLALSCLVTTGCGATHQAETATSSGPPANVACVWTVPVGPLYYREVPVTLSLDQADTNVTGNVSVARRTDLSGPVTGTIQGDLLTFRTATVGFGPLRVKEETMTGNFTSGARATLRRSK